MNQHEIIISGVHMELTDSIKEAIHHKFEKLFRHEERIIRIRVEVMHDKNARSLGKPFVAKAHIEINGPDIIISDAADDLYKALDELTEKLDRKLRRRARLDRVKRKDTHSIDLPSDLPKIAYAEES